MPEKKIKTGPNPYTKDAKRLMEEDMPGLMLAIKYLGWEEGWGTGYAQ